MKTLTVGSWKFLHHKTYFVRKTIQSSDFVFFYFDIQKIGDFLPKLQMPTNSGWKNMKNVTYTIK